MKRTYIVKSGPLKPIVLDELSKGLACHRAWRELCRQGFQITFQEFLEQTRVLRRH